MKKTSFPLLLVLFSLLANVNCNRPERIVALWPEGKIPNHIQTDIVEVKEQTDKLRLKNVQEPTLEVFLPEKSKNTAKAVLIFPGGGYGLLAYDWEGTLIAKFLNTHGIAGIVVKYRLPSDVTQTEKHKVPLIDAQRAMRLVRSKAKDWNIDTKQIGIIGFSAGGHVASTLGTRYNSNVYAQIDSIDTISARPDFMALLYPVISMGDKTHKGSRKNLLGKNTSLKMVNWYSNHLHVTENTPNTFLVHAIDDNAVPVANSEYFHAMLSVKGEGKSVLHLYEKGGHGFGLARGKSNLEEWPLKLITWINNLKME